ncbi:MAG: cytochrome b/b6 domain-containing protein [Acetobacteraceae bacterium]
MPSHVQQLSATFMNSITPRSNSRCAAAPAVVRVARSLSTRMIHLLLLLSVLHQLIGSEFMQRPFPGEPPAWPYSLHEYIGLSSLGTVGAFWVWTIVRHGETRLARLIPWFSIARLQDVAADLAMQFRRLSRGNLPDDEDGAFASAIHGLGLLAVTAMAMTGSVFFVTHGTSLAHTALSLHKLIANLVWVYLFAHAGVAVLHYLLGSDILSRMFWTR